MQMPTLSRRKLGVATGAAALLAMTALAACDPAPDGKVTQLTLAGSDTTQEVMGQPRRPVQRRRHLQHRRRRQPEHPRPADLGEDRSRRRLLRARSPGTRPPAPASASPPTAPAPGAMPCSPRSRPRTAASTWPGPRARLVRWARSPAPTWRRSGTSPTRSTPSAAAAGPNAPAGLTQAQLQDIYRCNITNWSALGGANAPIVRYWPPGRLGHPLVRPVRPARLRPDDRRRPARPCRRPPRRTPVRRSPPTATPPTPSSRSRRATGPPRPGGTVSDLRNGLEILVAQRPERARRLGHHRPTSTPPPVRSRRPTSEARRPDAGVPGHPVRVQRPRLDRQVVLAGRRTSTASAPTTAAPSRARSATARRPRR